MRLVWYREPDGWVWRDGDRMVGRAVLGMHNWYIDGDETPYALVGDAADDVARKAVIQ